MTECLSTILKYDISCISVLVIILNYCWTDLMALIASDYIKTESSMSGMYVSHRAPEKREL